MDYYQILNISTNASEQDIKKSYKKLALQYHPDKNKDPSANETFQRISEAYQTLSNKDSRRAYDLDGTIPDIFDNPSDIFEKIFKNMDPVIAKFLTSTLSNFTTTLLDQNKTFEDAFNQINTNDLIDKGGDVFKHYLKKNMRNSNSTMDKKMYDLNIQLDDISNNNDNQIDVNIEFLRTYSHIKLKIISNDVVENYILDLKEDVFKITFLEHKYIFELNYNFPYNVSRGKNPHHLFMNYNLNIDSYVNGFYFEYSLNSKINLKSNIIIKNSNIVCFQKSGLYNCIDDEYGNLYVTFIPSKNLLDEKSVNLSCSTLYSLESNHLIYNQNI
tara:strand:+ start:2257 stop:3243 length:987 start_codon:yes stop_codon:yes gene_type:complete